MALTLTIAGVDRTAWWYLPGLDAPGKMRFSRQTGGLGPASVDLYSIPGSTFYRPAIDNSLVISDGGVDLWAGVITDVAEDSLTDWDTGVVTHVTAADHARVFDQLEYSAVYPPATTLKAILQDLVAGPFAPYSITLDVLQATGPALDGVTFDRATGTSILNTLQTLAGYIWRLSTTKVLRMTLPGAESSGVTLSDSAGNVIDKVMWRQSRSQAYTNHVIVSAGDTTRVDKAYTFPAVPPATTQSNFPFPYPVAAHYGYITVNGAFTPIGPGLPWDWDSANNRIVASPAAVAGTVVAMTASVQFPIEVTASDAGEIAAHLTYTRRFSAPTVFDIVEAQQLANSLLRKGIATPRQITVRARSAGASIGQTVALSFTERNVSGTWIITAVDAEDDVDAGIIYTFTCLEGSTTEPIPTWLDFFRGMVSGGGSSGSVGGAVSAAVIPVPSGIFTETVIGDNDVSRVAIGFVGTPAGTESTIGSGLEARGSTPKWALLGAQNTFKEVRLQFYDTDLPFMVRDDTVLGGWAVMPGHITNAIKPCHLGSTTDAAGSGRWDHVYGKTVDASVDVVSGGGLWAHGRAVREGEWQDVTFNAAAFNADTGANWTLTSGDQTSLAYALNGLTLDYDFELFTTTVVGTPLYLKIALPGGRVVRHTKSGTIRRAFDNGTSITSKAGVVCVAGDNFIRIYKDDTGATLWSASTNLTDVSGTIRVPVDF